MVLLHRLFSRHYHFHIRTLISSKNLFLNPNHNIPPLHSLHSQFPNPSFNLSLFNSRCFSTDDGRRSTPGDVWRLSAENDDVFAADEGGPDGDVGVKGGDLDKAWNLGEENGGKGGGVDDVFGGDDRTAAAAAAAAAYDVFEGIDVGRGDVGKAWSLGGGEQVDDVFDLGEDDVAVETIEDEEKVREEMLRKQEEERKLDEEQKFLSTVVKGPNRAFGDLISASGITEEMLDSLMALKNLDGVQGLPPLREIEDMRYEKNTRKSSRADIERQKQEDVAKARVRQVDAKGRAYGTGRRKCSIARVWIQPGDGKFVINDKEFDVYFPMLDQRAALLRPFSETKTLGQWDISCTVKGGGTTGQVGAVQLGISRALQCWEPALRPPLRAVGFLTRDSRVVERKKPGKAKARKSFQWVKR